MADEIKPWNPEDALEKVRLKIQDAFVELIPQEQWMKMVKAVVDEFINGGKDRWGNPVESRLRVIIREELEKKSREIIVSVVSSPQYKGIWDYETQKDQPAEMVKKIIAEKAPEILAKVLSCQFQQIINHLQMPPPANRM